MKYIVYDGVQYESYHFFERCINKSVSCQTAKIKFVDHFRGINEATASNTARFHFFIPSDARKFWMLVMILQVMIQ